MPTLKRAISSNSIAFFMSYGELSVRTEKNFRLDRRKYPIGRKVTAEEMKHINIKRNRFHGEWNYMIKPKAKKT